MRVAPRHWLTLFACIAASGNAVAQASPPASGGTAPPAAPPAEAGDSHWQMPPLRLTGSLTYDFRAARSEQVRSQAHIATANIAASTYVYQPWIATVSGSLGLSSSRTTSHIGDLGAGDSVLHDSLRERQQFVTGSARLSLLPRSRFPAEVSYERQDSRTDSGLASPLEFQRQSLRITQQYRPVGNAWHLFGSYVHTVQDAANSHSTQDSLAATFGTGWQAHSLDLEGAFSRARNRELEEETRFTTLLARHAYSPGSTLSVNTTANFSRSEAFGPSNADIESLQLSSVGMYRPEESPWTLTGSVRGLAFRSGSTGSEGNLLGASLGATYEFSPQLRLTASAGATVTSSSGHTTTGFNGATSLTYQGNSLTFGGINYNWSASGSLSGSALSGDLEGTRSDGQLGLHIGHSATRNWVLGPRASFSVHAAQSLSLAALRNSEQDLALAGGPTRRTLVNTVGATLQRSGDGALAYARVSYNDSIELGGRNRFQLFNFQLSGNFDLGGGRSLLGDFTYQLSRQRSDIVSFVEDTAVFGLQQTRSRGMSGEITFTQTQLFGVPRLTFVSRLRLAQDVLSQPGQIVSIPDRETRLWENRLDWAVGRLTAQAQLRISEVDGHRISSLWLRGVRSFGP